MTVPYIFSPGTKASSSEVNANFEALNKKVLHIDTSTDLNIAAASYSGGTTASTTKTYELDGLDFVNKDYIQLFVGGLFSASAGTTASTDRTGSITIKLEKDEGEGFESLIEQTICSAFVEGVSGGRNHNNNSTYGFLYYIPITTEMLTKADIKITLNGFRTDSGATGTYTNHQIIFETK